jgi:WhiB family transcriptional regulator, redox-sensing transcriptional regulator
MTTQTMTHTTPTAIPAAIPTAVRAAVAALTNAATPDTARLASVGSIAATVSNLATSPVKWDVDHWRTEAACSSLDTNLFFPDPDTDDDVLPQIAAAKGVCAACPVRQSCLEFAIRTRQLDGVWGGHTPEERRSIRRRRQAAARRAAAA